jgi:signal transduction histidine kinase
MGLLKRNLGVEKLAIKEKDEKLIYEQLRKIDEYRLELFASISLVAISLIVILDFIYFDEKLRYFYLTFDLTLWAFSLLTLAFSFFSRKKKSKTILSLNKIMLDLFPLFMLLWSTAICALDPSSILNIITFYFVVFLFAFAVLTSLKTFLLYYLVIFVEFIVIKLIIEQPIFTENTAAMLVVCLLILPFYYSFRSTRVNSQAAIVMLNDAKKNLEEEVSIRTRELLFVNNNLKDEIGQRKVIESKLRETLKLAESNSQLKSEFLANISHEIRTPLNAIVGFTEMLTEDGVPPERKKEYQYLVEVNTSLLLSIIDDIFDASLIRTDQINPIIKPISVNSFLSSLSYDLNSIALKYEKQHLALLKHPCEKEELIVHTDEYFLKKAFLRLIDNAYKFTEQGKIEIGVSTEKDRIELFVSDTGKGISEKDSIKIFEPFVQGDGSFTRDYGGAGLGLTIVKGITQALGASLSFKSKPGMGTTFTISFKNSIFQN